MVSLAMGRTPEPKLGPADRSTSDDTDRDVGAGRLGGWRLGETDRCVWRGFLRRVATK